MISLLVIGNLGKDAEVKEVNGKKVIEFTVAHSQKLKDGSTKTTWVQCSKWGDTTAVAPYMKKGGKVAVEGIPEAQGWTNKEGQAQATLRLMVNRIELLGGGAQATEGQPAASNVVNTDTPEEISDLPF